MKRRFLWSSGLATTFQPENGDTQFEIFVNITDVGTIEDIIFMEKGHPQTHHKTHSGGYKNNEQQEAQ